MALCPHNLVPIVPVPLCLVSCLGGPAHPQVSPRLLGQGWHTGSGTTKPPPGGHHPPWGHGGGSRAGRGHQVTAAGYKYWLNRFIFIQRIHRSPLPGHPDPGGHPKMSPATPGLATTSVGFTGRICPHSQSLVTTLGHLGDIPVPSGATLLPVFTRCLLRAPGHRPLCLVGQPQTWSPAPLVPCWDMSGHFGVPLVP